MVHVAHAVAVFGALYETCQPHTGWGEIQQTRLMHESLGAGHTQQQSRISTEWNINIQIKQDPDKEVTQCKDCSLGKCRHVHRLRSTTQHLTTGHSSTWSLCLFERRCAVLPMFIHEHNSATLHQEIHLQHSWQKLQELECTQNSTIDTSSSHGDQVQLLTSAFFFPSYKRYHQHCSS